MVIVHSGVFRAEGEHADSTGLRGEMETSEEMSKIDG